MAFIVELFGMPGAGKTTIRTLLTQCLEADGIEVVDTAPPRSDKRHLIGKVPPVAIVLSRLGLAVRKRHALWWCLRVLQQSPRPLRQKTTAFRLVFVTWERYDSCRRDTSDRAYILDEGSLQRLFLLLVEHDGARSEVDRSVYMDSAPLGDVLVHVQVSPEQALARLGVRERGLPPRLQGLDQDQVERCLAQGDTLLSKAAEEAVSLPGRVGPDRFLAEISGTIKSADLKNWLKLQEDFSTITTARKDVN